MRTVQALIVALTLLAAAAPLLLTLDRRPRFTLRQRLRHTRLAMATDWGMAKFFRRGKSKIYFCPTIAAPATGVTTAELTAGVNLSASIAAVGGFQLTNSPINTPNLAESFTGQIEGEDTVADSTLNIYDDDAASTNRDALEKGTVGYIVLLPYGSAVGKRAETWPVRSLGYNDAWTLDNEAAQSVVGFAVSSTPTQAGAVLA